MNSDLYVDQLLGFGLYSIIISIIIVITLTYFCFFTMWENDYIDPGIIKNKVNIPGIIEFNTKQNNSEEENIPLSYVYNPSKKLKPPMAPVNINNKNNNNNDNNDVSPVVNNQQSKIINKLPPSIPVNHLGELKIKIIKGNDIKSAKSIFGEADVYALLQIGNQKKETTVKKEGGQNPVWDEELTFNITDRDDTLHITIFDKETVDKDRYLAQSSVSILDWVTHKQFEGSLNLIDKRNKNEGQLLLSALFIPTTTTTTTTTTENSTKVGSWV